MRSPLIVLALLMLALWAGPASANPFTDGKPDRTVETAQPAQAGAVGRWLQQAQGEASHILNATLARMRDETSAEALFAGLLVAFLYGVLHAAGPGHGKAVVISYFLSRDATLMRGLALGGRIALTHVASAILVAGVTWLILKEAIPRSLEDMHEIKLASYGSIGLIGLVLLVQAIRRRREGLPAHACCVDHGHHDHEHQHHGHDHHNHDQRPARNASWIGVLLGMVPCTGAIIVLMFTFANGMLWSGLLLVAAIGLGMALTMAALGSAAILARDRVTRWASRADGDGRLTQVMDYGGPIFILGFGLALTWASL